jgi:endoglucanase
MHATPPMPRRTFLATVAATTAAGALLPLAPRALADQPEIAARPGIPASRLASLSRGINLSHWMWYPQAQGEQARRAFITASDLKQLVDAGFNHARLPFEPDWIWDAEHHRLNKEAGKEYFEACNLCIESGLSLIVDAHWSRTPWIRPGEPTHAPRMGELERMWATLAERWRTLDPERTILEIINEPHDIAAAAWAESQSIIARAIRAAAPDHTILATGASWGSIDGLLDLAPLDDPNVVYSFHFYEPHNFTHQGASWGFPPWKDMKNVPWPGARADIEALADTFPAASRDALRWSARDGTSDPWTAEALDARVDRAHQWSLTHSRPIYCGEFGAHKPTAPRDSRVNWTRALTESLSKRSIGWAMWDYIGGFAIADGEPGARTLDADLCDTLGLRRP